MRILIFNWRDITHPWAGGAEVNIHEQAKRWAMAGHQVTLFCGWYEGASRYAEIDGIEIVRRGGRFTVYLWAAIYYLVRFRGKYDVIVDMENGIPFFTPIYSRVPKICMAHHVHTEQFLTDFSPPLSWIGIFLESKIMPIVYRRVAFVTISESSRQELAGIGVDPKRCSVIYCGLCADTHHPGGPKTQQPSLIYLGRLMRYKRVDILIELMTAVIQEHPHAVLHIVGSGPTNGELRQLARRYGLDSNVVFHGHASEEEKVSLLQQAWVLVTPSMKEGWGLVAVEANACGTPVIAFNVPGLCEAVRHQESGLLVNTREGFLGAILNVLHDQDLRDRLSRGGIEHAKSFDWESSAERMLRVISLASEGSRDEATSYGQVCEQVDSSALRKIGESSEACGPGAFDSQG